MEGVLGFIKNGGRSCLTCGCWKVYANEHAALKAFRRYAYWLAAGFPADTAMIENVITLLCEENLAEAAEEEPAA